MTFSEIFPSQAYRKRERGKRFPTTREFIKDLSSRRDEADCIRVSVLTWLLRILQATLTTGAKTQSITFSLCVWW